MNFVFSDDADSTFSHLNTCMQTTLTGAKTDLKFVFITGLATAEAGAATIGDFDAILWTGYSGITSLTVDFSKLGWDETDVDKVLDSVMTLRGIATGAALTLTFNDHTSNTSFNSGLESVDATKLASVAAYATINLNPILGETCVINSINTTLLPCATDVAIDTTSTGCSAVA